MTEKRFNIFDVDGTVFLEDHKEGSYHIGEKENVDIPCLNDIADRLNTYVDENEQLKAQLYCDDEEGVCNICKHHYLVKDDETELGYYNSRCRKGHYECARVSLKHCEDFEKELEE